VFEWLLAAILSKPLSDSLVEAQILDRREQNYFFKNYSQFYHDLETCFNRLLNLHNAPPLEDHQRFDKEIINDLVHFNNLAMRYVERQTELKIHQAEHWCNRLTTLKQTKAILSELYDAKCDYYYLPVRRSALKKARDLMGPGPYYAGQLPAAVPTEFLRRVDD